MESFAGDVNLNPSGTLFHIELLVRPETGIIPCVRSNPSRDGKNVVRDFRDSRWTPIPLMVKTWFTACFIFPVILNPFYPVENMPLIQSTIEYGYSIIEGIPLASKVLGNKYVSHER